MRTRLIAVIGNGGDLTADQAQLAESLGAALVEAGYGVVCGGLGGVMEAAARGAVTQRGAARHPPVVGILPHYLHDQGNDYLEDAAMNLLGLAVGHWEDMRVFDDERTSSLLRRREIDSPKDIDFDAAQAMARDAKVGTLVLGDIRREGDSLALEAKIRSGDLVDREADWYREVPDSMTVTPVETPAEK